MKSIQFDMVLKIFNMLLCVSYGTRITEIYSNNLNSRFDQGLTSDVSTIYQSEWNKIGLEPVTINGASAEKVTLQIYYECLCPDCRSLDSEQLVPLVRKLGYFLNIITYPYGNAETLKDSSGHYTFRCQHGPKECYGNKLHACVIDALQNNTLAVFFNACMMDYSQTGYGSDDKAADVCGRAMGLDTTPIKRCAKGERGTTLLKYYGDESKKANFNYVPYIVINGKVSDGEDLMKDVCKAFKTAPEACNK